MESFCGFVERKNERNHLSCAPNIKRMSVLTSWSGHPIIANPLGALATRRRSKHFKKISDNQTKLFYNYSYIKMLLIYLIKRNTMMSNPFIYPHLNWWIKFSCILYKKDYFAAKHWKCHHSSLRFVLRFANQLHKSWTMVKGFSS